MIAFQFRLASPALTAAAREALERRTLASERIGAPEIRAARGALKSGRSSAPGRLQPKALRCAWPLSR